METEFIYRPEDKFARCVHTGSIAFSAFHELAKLIRNYSDEHKVYRILLDTAAATGNLTVMERYVMGDQSAELIGFKLRLAIYGTKTQIREDRFGIMVARRRGTQVNAFTDLQEAERWILSDG